MNQLNGSKRDTDPVEFEVCGKDKHYQTKILEDLFDNDGSVDTNSLRNEDSDGEKSEESIQSRKKREFRDSSSVKITISDLFDVDEDSYTDRNVLECEVPVLTAWYKEEKVLIKSCEVGTLVEPSEESLVEQKLPIQEFGTRSFLRSFVTALEDRGTKTSQPLDQGFPEDEVSERHASSSAVASPKGDSRSTNIPYDSKVENGTITFDFKYPAALRESRITNRRRENLKENSVESRNLVEYTSLNADDISDARSTSLVQSSGTLSIKNVTSILAQGSSYDEKRTEISNVESLEHECCDSNDLSATSVDPHVIKTSHESPSSDGVSTVPSVHYKGGESSDSAAGLVTILGPVEYSGSLSLRSEGSATSGGSFAFPILQSEWNSSPVRMANDDGSHFRKHRGWRSGLLCCKF